MPSDGWRTVTEVVEATVNPGEALLRHANREGLEGRALLSEDRQDRLKTGAVVHEVLERLARGEAVDPSDFEPHRRGFVVGLLTWHRRLNRRLLAAEVPLESKRLKVRGRTDLVRACQRPTCGCGGEGAVLLDLKIGKLVTYLGAHLQVSGYELMWEEEGKAPPVCGGEVLCVTAAGSFQSWPVLAEPRHFAAAAAWHELLAPLRLAVNEQKGASS